MFDNVNWDSYVNPPEYYIDEEPEDDYDDSWLQWFDDNQEWLDYLENINEATIF